MHKNSNMIASLEQSFEHQEHNQGEILLKDQEHEWILDGIGQNHQNGSSKMNTNHNNTSPLKCSTQYSLIDQNLIQQSNLKPTLISQGLFAFEEDERSNLGFLNSQYGYEYKGDMEEFEGEEQEEFDEDDEEDQIEDEERQYAQSEGEDNNNNHENKIDQNNNNKSFACRYEDCGKLFKAKKSLRDHLRIHTNQRPYSCTEQFCGKSFVQYSSLQKHQRTHKGDRPYKCDYDDCDQAFTQISNLKRHQKIHLNDKPYVCQECLRKFTTSSNLKQHTITHGSQGMRQRFKCVIDECGKSYLYSSSLKKHEKEHILSSKTNPVGQVNSNQIVNELCGLHGNNPNNQIVQQQLQQQQSQPLISGSAFEGEAIQSSREDVGNNNNNTDLTHEKEDSEAKDSFVQYEEQLKQSGQQEEHKSFPETAVSTVSNNAPASHGPRVNMEDMDMLGQFFDSHHVALQHDGHYDVLFKGYLYHYNRKSGKIEIHEIQAHDEITKGTCQPLSEKSHSLNEEINLKLNELEHIHCKEQAVQSQITPGIAYLEMTSCCKDRKKSESASASVHHAPQDNVQPVICCSEPNCTKELIQDASRDEFDRNSNQNEKGNDLHQEQTGLLLQESQISNENNNNFNGEGAIEKFQNEQAEEIIKSEDCCCIVDNVKMECTCIGCDADCPTCKTSRKCIFRKMSNSNTTQHDQDHSHLQSTDYIHLTCKSQTQQNQQVQQLPLKQKQLQNYQLQSQPEQSKIPLQASHSQQAWWHPVADLDKINHVSKCLCLETKDMKHFHGPNCGHVPIYHHGHLDYIVENQLHHPHGTHCDFHGTVSVLDNIARI